MRHIRAFDFLCAFKPRSRILRYTKHVHLTGINLMKPLSVMVLALGLLALSGCSVLQGKPVPPPPPADHAQEIQRDQTSTLTIIGRITVEERGSPMDAEHAVRDQANARHATYYQIVALSELITSGTWRAEAILYR